MSAALKRYPKTHYEYIRSPTSDQYENIDNHVRLARGMLFRTIKDKEHLSSATANWLMNTFVSGPWDDVARTEVFCMLRYEDFGRQVFALNPIIQEMFDNTDVSRVGEAELSKLPYPCFYINLLGSSFTLQSPEDGKYYPISGFYVLRDNSDKDVPSLTFFLHAEGPNGKFGSKFYFSLALNQCFEKFDSVGDYIKHVIKDPKRDSSSPGVDRTLKDQKETGKTFLHIYRIFAAFLMYLNTEDPSLRKQINGELEARRRRLEKKVRSAKNPSKKRKYAATLSRLQKNRKTVVYVGEREERRILEQCGGNYESERHWRRGHDHRFWYGPLKNKETGEDWSKVPEGMTTEEYWTGKRELRSRWLEPTLIRADKEAVNEGGNRIYSLAVPSSYLEKQRILRDMCSSVEGKMVEVTLTKPERSRKNQQACFEHWGFECRICGFSPAKDHPLGHMVESMPSQGLEAHHLHPLGDGQGERLVNPIEDMRPLCNVCHKVVHARGSKVPPRDVERLRSMVQEEVVRKSDGVLQATPDPVQES